MRVMLRKVGELAFSFPLLIVIAALCVASYFAITSATFLNEKLQEAPISQIKYDVAGLLVFLVIALTPYKVFLRAAPWLYGAGVLLLVACFVPHVGRKVYNAYSWIKIGPVGFEPTEFAKIAYILFLAWFLQVRERKIENFSTVVMAWAFTAVPFLLILKQPALGSASVFFPVCFCMLFAAGVRLRYIVLPVLAVVGMITLTFYWVHVWDKPIPLLKPFQQDRVRNFFDPSLDPRGTGWQADQSVIAIGSGGMDGKGLGQGTQTETALGYLPKTTSYNDLIFSVVGEIFGFRGGATLILCEGAVLLWCTWVASRARDKVGALLAVGVMTMLFTHIFVNIGMTIQLVPITGIPLPFISYGGTFVIACLAAMGLVQSVWVHRKNLERA
jgi:rod shape determining protein RodA